MVKDPVCGMMVNSKNPPAVAEHENRLYFFCSSACRHQFLENPSAYKKESAPKDDVPPSGNQ